MPTIARIGPYRIYFYSHDMHEPPHVHVDREAKTAKFWLAPPTLAYNIGYRAKELGDIRRIVNDRAAEFVEAWNDYFGT